MLEIRKLRYFVAVAEELHFGRAALRLHMSQPPLSRHIKELEELLDAQLFNRSSHGIELTNAGEALLPEAKRILAMVEHASEVTTQAKRGEIGRLDVGYYGTGIFEMIPHLLKGFKREHPDIAISLQSINKRDQLKALRSRNLHVGFTRYITEAPDLETILIASEPLHVALSSEEWQGGDDALELADVAALPLILFPGVPRPSFADEVLKLFADADLQPRISQEAEDAVSAVALVGAGFGCAVVPRSALSLRLPGVTYRPLAEPTPACELACVYLAGERPPVLDAFVKFVEAARPPSI